MHADVQVLLGCTIQPPCGRQVVVKKILPDSSSTSRTSITMHAAMLEMFNRCLYLSQFAFSRGPPAIFSESCILLLWAVITAAACMENMKVCPVIYWKAASMHRGCLMMA